MVDHSTGAMLGFGITAFMVLLALLGMPRLKETYPTNLALLGIFTVLESFFVGVLCVRSRPCRCKH